MKYHLKKDLPFAKAGVEVRLFLGSAQYTIFYNDETETIDIYYKYEIDRSSLLKDGWIEEIKPREWWIIKDSNYSESIATCLYSSYAKASNVLNTQYRKPEEYSLIKVYEAIE